MKKKKKTQKYDTVNKNRQGLAVWGSSEEEVPDCWGRTGKPTPLPLHTH
jgi:hypothetical protein